MERYCETCQRMTDAGCKDCADFEPLRCMIIIDGDKNMLRVSYEDFSKMYDALGRRSDVIMKNVIRHDTLADLDRDVHGYIKLIKEVQNEYRRKH